MSTEMLVRPEDYLSDSAQLPDRIMSTEIEYAENVGNDKILDMHVYEKLGLVVCRSAQIGDFRDYLDNGFQVYEDGSRASTGPTRELAGPESLGPQDATVTDMAGVIIMRHLAEMPDAVEAEIEGRGVFRTSGTTVEKYGRHSSMTLGNQINAMIPNEVFEKRSGLFQTILSSHLASRVWAHSGSIGPDGFVLSQKISGIDTEKTGLSLPRNRSEEQPLVKIYAPNGKTGSSDWRRVEVRYSDASLFPEHRFLDMASISLVLRLIEHADKVDLEHLKQFSFNQPNAAAHTFARDMSFEQTTLAIDGAERVRALEYQQELLDALDELRHKVQLPEDEETAIDMWREVVEALSGANLDEGEYGGSATDMLYVVARHKYLARKVGLDGIRADNPRAVALNLKFDRIQPDGQGYKLSRALDHKSNMVTWAEIEKRASEPPATRALPRSALLNYAASEGIKVISAGWNRVVLEGRSGAPVEYFFDDPYNTAIPEPRAQDVDKASATLARRRGRRVTA